MTPLDLISAHPWRRAAFTTYALSLSFVEAVVLDALVRGGGRQALILADVAGVRAALMEQGARRAGRDYEVEPVAVHGGVFHPKISVLTSEAETHVVVGSGNLTFGGWGGNLEVFEHLHPSFAADAIEDAADFFDYLSLAEQVRHGASEHCGTIANELRASIRGQRRNGNIRLFHNLDGAILEKLSQTAADLGGATRVVAAAPFWDGGSAIDRLCEAVGVDHVFVHAHAGGTVAGDAGFNWPVHARNAVHAVRLHVLDEQNHRLLHAKVFEVICKRGRVLLSGSANATTAALGSGRNVEACVARIQRERLIGWTYSGSEPPEVNLAPDELAKSEDVAVGVLRAVLEGEWISGQILAPSMTGAASVFQMTTEGPELLGKASVAADGSFAVEAPGLEVQSWKGGRLVVRIELDSGQAAEGFVSVAAFAEITRRAGALAPRLLAVLAGTETPADVAAIMSWFHEDPRRLAGTVPMRIASGGIESDRGTESEAVVAIAELNSEHAAHLSSHVTDEVSGSTGWSRFMDHVFAAFRERRGAFGETGSGRKGDDEGDDDNSDGATNQRPRDPAIDRSITIFERLLDQMLAPENAGLHAMVAFDLTQYVCERLQPDIGVVRAWLERLISALLRVGPPPERRDDVAAAIVTLLGAAADSNDDRRVRGWLRRLGVDLSGDPPSSERAQGFQSVLLQSDPFPALWARLRAVRTYPELTQSYVAALDGDGFAADLRELAQAVPEEWPVLEKALRSAEVRKRISILDRMVEACPRCHMKLPSGELFKLRSRSCATAKNCCHRVLLVAGAD